MQFECNCNIQSVAKTLSEREIFTQHRNVCCVVEQQKKKKKKCVQFTRGRSETFQN